MNPDVIATRDEALALLEADLVTIQDYILLCRFKGWNLTGDSVPPASTEQSTSAGRNALFPCEGRDASRRTAQRSTTVPATAPRELPVSLRARILPLSLRKA
ncbi:hypothetical protein [Methylorubrum thiocyanatum]|uniref:hypothetical protein n=1 Tax=Methylorubrum thiocyanatum TaxID=47958 RepID=UPI0035C855BF